MSDASEVKRYFIETIIGNTCAVYEEKVDGLDSYTEMVTASDHDRIVAELKAELEIQNKANEILTRQTDELRAELTEAKAEVERVKSKDSELIKCLQDLTGANNQVNPHLGVAAGVALMKAELTDSNKTIATQARKLDLARVLYHAAIKMIDRYSKEKFPLNQTHTVEDVMDRYDKELAAIEKERGAKDE